MRKILIGLLALVVLAVFVGAATNWYIGLAVVLAPMAVIYTLLKISTTFRASTDEIMTRTLGE